MNLESEALYLSVMEEAQALAWQKSNRMGGKLSTFVRTSGRKALKNLPVTALKFAVGKIPVIGSEAVAGVTFLATKIRNNRVKSKALAAIMPRAGAAIAEEGDAPASSSAATDVKALAKDLQLIAQTFDRNVGKFATEMESVKTGLSQLGATPTTTFQVWMQHYSQAAYHYFRLIHYTEKLAVLRDRMEERLAIASKYVDDVDKWAVELEEHLKTGFVAGMDAIEDEGAGLLHPMKRSSSSSRLS